MSILLPAAVFTAGSNFKGVHKLDQTECDIFVLFEIKGSTGIQVLGLKYKNLTENTEY